MATVEEASEYLGGLAAFLDDELTETAPEMTFALVVWKRGFPEVENAVCVVGDPDFRTECPVALLTASKWSGWKR